MADSTVPKQLTPWAPGQSGNPAGRPKGSRNKLSEDFAAALHADFQEHGAEAIARTREEHPETYVRVIASLLPKEVKVETSPVEALSDDELASLIHSVRSAASATVSVRSRAGETSGPH